MSRPRIYGSEASCRAALVRYIGRADELLDQAAGVRNRLASTTNVFVISAIEYEWEKDVRRLFLNARRGLGRYLQEELPRVLPTLALGLPPDTGKPRHQIGLDNGEPWIRECLTELKELQALLGVRRGVARKAPEPARFEELYASGLVAEEVISDHAKDMLSPRTPRQLSNAIGSAKELTEATLRAALDRLDQPYRRGDDLPTLMKKWRRAVVTMAPPDPLGQGTLDQAQAALANLVTFLAEWRNAYGRGHGRPRYPPGLATRHARLAADAAETSVRFIVATMDDLQLLPP